MHYQTKSYYCGPASIQNAAELLGKRATQRKIASLCGTTTDGTDEFGMLRGIDGLGLAYSLIEQDRPSRALRALQACWPTIICTDQWSHWCCVIPARNNRYILIDPARPGLNTWAKAPTSIVSGQALTRRWKAAWLDLRPVDAIYYGITVELPYVRSK